MAIPGRDSQSSSGPVAPRSLGERGRELWDDLFAPQSSGGVLDLNPKEMSLLIEACRTLDRIEALEALLADGIETAGSTGQTVVHPAVAELRQQQAGYIRLIGAIDLPEDLEAADRFKTSRGKAGADARWNRPKAVARG